MSLQQGAENYERALEHHRAEQAAKGDQRSEADKLRDRLKYATDLRRKADAAERIAESLNYWIQRPGKHDNPTLIRRARRVFFRHAGSEIELTAEEVESIFTWMMDHKDRLREHADRIEKEVTSS